jgi:hypothetical protein
VNLEDEKWHSLLKQNFRNINFTGEIKSGLSQNQHGSERKYIFTDVITTDAPITHVISIFLLDLAHQQVKNSFGRCFLFHLNWL